jgi:hypothetical protein
MANEKNDWKVWARFFANRSNRALPALKVDQDYSTLPASLSDSLAIFQLGESGGGTIVKQALHSKLNASDEYYAAAMALFVEEEHRHANILAMCVRLLGGKLIRDNWTARLFVFARRLIGLRLKVVVLLAAEVVGICYYHLLAVQLPEGRLKKQLLEIVEDERSHLYFHCDFLRSQTPKQWQKRVFMLVWRLVMVSAAIVVAIDHRKAIRDLDIGLKKVLFRWKSYSKLAEVLVVAERTGSRRICSDIASTKVPNKIMLQTLWPRRVALQTSDESDDSQSTGTDEPGSGATVARRYSTP